MGDDVRGRGGPALGAGTSMPVKAMRRAGDDSKGTGGLFNIAKVSYSQGDTLRQRCCIEHA